MINKIYEKTKSFIQENYLILLFYIVIVALFTYPLPYYIYTGGGTLNVKDKIIIKNKKESTGSYNLCYVNEIYATIPSYLFSMINKNWEVVKKEEVSLNKSETDKDIMLRDRVYLKQSNQSAVISAFKLANKEYKIVSNNVAVIYVMEEADTDLKIGDSIISINGVNISSRDDILNLIKNYNSGDRIEIKVLNNNKMYNRYATIIESKGNKLIGIALENMIEYKTNPEIKFNFKKSELGPSGGFMLSLAIYDYLMDEDISKGYKISGTGTIDNDGNIGSIGGVKYKLSGAVKSKSDIFFVPAGENYEEAIKVKKKKKYKIDIVSVSTLNDAVKYLESK